MEPLTLFTWGYWGWGSATADLVQAVDAVEAARGYKPPMFVDIRLSRSVRALGFRDRAFESLVGQSRYRWLDSLGNLAVKEGGPTRIKEPAAAETLLDIAETCARDTQRVIFFCACQDPLTEDDPRSCHRVTVARLVLEAAGRRKTTVTIVEWPGGDAQLTPLNVRLSPKAFGKIKPGPTSVPLEEPVALAKMAAVPYFSLAVGREDGDGDHTVYLLVIGPARYKKGGWYLPCVASVDAPSKELPSLIKKVRKQKGYEPRTQSAVAIQMKPTRRA